MNLILLFKEDFINASRVRLTGRRAEHIVRVLRPGEGDTLAVGLMNGLIGTGRVESVGPVTVELEIILTENPPQQLPLTLILALPRPKALRRVLQTTASMGVKKVFLINACRVEKSFWQSPFLGEEVVYQQLVLGLEQARDTIMPEVFMRPLFRPFVEDELPEIMKQTTALAAHPGVENECPRNVSGSITLAIGPEGGFVPYEIERLTAAGFQTISLGQRVLRVEAAVPALLSRLF